MQIFSYSTNDFSMHHTIDEHPDEFNFPMHAHPYCELYYFISGSGYYTVEGNNYPLSQGSVMIMRQGETHKIHIDSSLPYERMAVHFLPESLPMYTADMHSLYYQRPLGKGNLIECNESSKKFILSCLQRISRVKKSENEFETMVSYFLPIFSELASQAKLNENIGQPDGDSKLVIEMIEYINEHLAEIKSLDDVEQRFYFSRSYLNRIFKKITGSSLWNYIILKRLITAQNEIKSGKSAALAAASCGFGDYSSFYRLYKKKFGVEPRAEKNAKNKKPNFSLE